MPIDSLARAIFVLCVKSFKAYSVPIKAATRIYMINFCFCPAFFTKSEAVKIIENANKIFKSIAQGICAYKSWVSPSKAISTKAPGEVTAAVLIFTANSFIFVFAFIPLLYKPLQVLSSNNARSCGALQECRVPMRDCMREVVLCRIWGCLCVTL